MQFADASTAAGTLDYTPAADTVLKAGTETLSVTLTPKDTATATMALTLSQATPARGQPTLGAT